jgi:Amt family ammonium transporter
MQAGFAMLEAGIVHPKNVTNILFKNIIDASLAALVFWAVGYGQY